MSTDISNIEYFANAFFGVLAVAVTCLSCYAIFCGLKYILGKVVFQQYRIDHYQEKDAYYPMAKTLCGWRYITTNGQRHYLKSFEDTVLQNTLKQGESMVRRFHEERTKSTVVSLDVKINEILLKKRKAIAQKYNSKYNATH
jgi:hypothetical protein